MTPDPIAVALIPARQGSKRVPGKNVRLLNGHPMLAYTIAPALESGVFDAVVVSTDSEETAAIAREYGAEVPFLRPAAFATDTSPDIEWVGVHAAGAAGAGPQVGRVFAAASNESVPDTGDDPARVAAVHNGPECGFAARDRTVRAAPGEDVGRGREPNASAARSARAANAAVA
jgi:hypothetical protein